MHLHGKKLWNQTNIFNDLVINLDSNIVLIFYMKVGRIDETDILDDSLTTFIASMGNVYVI